MGVLYIYQSRKVKRHKILTASGSLRNSFVFPIFHFPESKPADLRIRRHPSARSPTHLCLVSEAIIPSLLSQNKTLYFHNLLIIELLFMINPILPRWGEGVKVPALISNLWYLKSIQAIIAKLCDFS